ncbi:MAG TPA: hypothetical protein VEO54_26150 [Thermoanaerobaculia bacterium]|nr:hypothetical protein [Thermoanaerobaculia bacterium]
MLRAIVAVLASLVWLKGNLHTHTSQSDGDSPPAEVAAWYRDRGYDFLVIHPSRCCSGTSTPSAVRAASPW